MQDLSLSANLNIPPWTIPTELTQATGLLRFYASETNIFGSLPDFFGSFPNLTHLRLTDNNLSGTLPQSFRGSKIQNLRLNRQKNEEQLFLTKIFNIFILKLLITKILLKYFKYFFNYAVCHVCIFCF